MTKPKETKRSKLITVSYKLGKKHGYHQGYRAGKKYAKKKVGFPTFEEAFKSIRGKKK